MGYSTDRFGRLVCDRCGSSGNARRRRCPHEWCGPEVLCPDCFAAVKADGSWTKAHAGCAKSSAEYREHLEAERAAMESGAFVRCSALTVSPGVVHVIFKGNAGCVGRYMSPELYHLAAPFSVWTLDRFETIANAAGETLKPAPADFFTTPTEA